MTDESPTADYGMPATPAAPVPSYAQFAPSAARAEAEFAQAARSRRHPPWWVWLIAGCFVLFQLMVGSAVSKLVVQATGERNASPNYTGEPVEASDATATTVVSDDATVEYNIGPDWVSADGYVNVSNIEASLTTGETLTGAHLTSDPSSSTPHFVVVTEHAPEGNVYRSLEQAMKGAIKGVKAAHQEFDDATAQPYSTGSGLTGYIATFHATTSGPIATMTDVVLGHGKRMVLVQWITYEGPTDEAAQTAFLDSLRIDE